MNQRINIPELTEQIKERLTKENKTNKVKMNQIQFDEMVSIELKKQFKTLLENE